MEYNAKNIWKSCLRKAKFKDYKQACKKAEQYNQRVYFCPLCGYYHLTKTKEIKNESEGTD